MIADRLTLETFGVELDALARRITDRQAELGRDDDACAKLAGVTVERWQAWRDGREWPGVGRVPKLAGAIDATPAWILYGATANGTASTPAIDPPTYDARRALELLTTLAPTVEAIIKAAAEIARHNVPIPGGRKLGVALEVAACTIGDHDAVAFQTRDA